MSVVVLELNVFVPLGRDTAHAGGTATEQASDRKQVLVQESAMHRLDATQLNRELILDGL
jgi:hypothetical protein